MKPTMTPNLTDLFDDSDERAVSPVIGVILMVAITVILAAVIGTFVLNLSKSTGNVAPKATFQFQDADDAFTDANAENDTYFRLKMTGGSDISSGDIKIVIRDPDTSQVVANFTETRSYLYNVSGDYSVPTYDLNTTFNSFTSNLTTGTTIGAGDSIFVNEADDLGNTKDTGFSSNSQFSIEIIHEPTGKTIDQGTVQLK